MSIEAAVGSQPALVGVKFGFEIRNKDKEIRIAFTGILDSSACNRMLASGEM